MSSRPPERCGGSFNHLIGEIEHASRHGEAQDLGSFEVDDQREFRRVLNWEVGGTSAPEDPILGAWLFLTPWIFGFVPNTAASWNAWLSGVAIGVVALAALLAFAEWEEWINLLLGVWVAVSAWAVGFAVHATATWVHVVTGIIVAVVAGVRLWLMHRTPPRLSA